MDSERADEIELAARGLRTMLQFCWDGVVLSEDDPSGLRLAIRRFVAIAATNYPDVLHGDDVPVKTSGPRGGKTISVDGPPLTLRQLAAQPQVKSHEKQLKKMAEDFLSRLLPT